MVAQHLLDAILMSRDDGENRQRSQNCQHCQNCQRASRKGDGQAKASEYLESSAAVVDLINNQNPLALEAIAHTRDGIEPLKLCRPLPACVCLVVVELQAHGDDGDLDKGAEHAGGNEASAADGDHKICGMVGRRYRQTGKEAAR
jgi:hypothetical protein